MTEQTIECDYNGLPISNTTWAISKVMEAWDRATLFRYYQTIPETFIVAYDDAIHYLKPKHRIAFPHRCTRLRQIDICITWRRVTSGNLRCMHCGKPVTDTNDLSIRFKPHRVWHASCSAARHPVVNDPKPLSRRIPILHYDPVEERERWEQARYERLCERQDQSRQGTARRRATMVETEAILGLWSAFVTSVPEWFARAYFETKVRQGGADLVRDGSDAWLDCACADLLIVATQWVRTREHGCVCYFCGQPVVPGDQDIRIDRSYIWHASCRDHHIADRRADEVRRQAARTASAMKKEAERAEKQRRSEEKQRRAEENRKIREALEAQRAMEDRKIDEATAKIKAVDSLRNKTDICAIIKTHHAILKDDPDRLGSDFLIRLIAGEEILAAAAEEPEFPFYSVMDLKLRGWTVTAIRKFLGMHDAEEIDPTRLFSKHRHLYHINRVEEAERTGPVQKFHEVNFHKRQPRQRKKPDEE